MIFAQNLKKESLLKEDTVTGLNAREKEQTRIELNENDHILNIDPEIIQADLKWSRQQL